MTKVYAHACQLPDIYLHNLDSMHHHSFNCFLSSSSSTKVPTKIKVGISYACFSRRRKKQIKKNTYMHTGKRIRKKPLITL